MDEIYIVLQKTRAYNTRSQEQHAFTDENILRTRGLVISYHSWDKTAHCTISLISLHVGNAIFVLIMVIRRKLYRNGPKGRRYELKIQAEKIQGKGETPISDGVLSRPRKQHGIIIATIAALLIGGAALALNIPESPFYVGNTSTTVETYKGDFLTVSMMPSPGYMLIDSDDGGEMGVIGDFAVLSTQSLDVIFGGTIEDEGYYEQFSEGSNKYESDSIKVLDDDGKKIVYEDSEGAKYVLTKVNGIPGSLTLSLENCEPDDAVRWVSGMSFKYEEMTNHGENEDLVASEE